MMININGEEMTPSPWWVWGERLVTTQEYISNPIDASYALDIPVVVLNNFTNQVE